MYSQITTAVRLAAVSVLAAAILAPAAGAGRYSIAAPPPPHYGKPGATCHQYCGVQHSYANTRPATTRSLVRTEVVPTSGGFDWTDAAIGFAIGIGAMVLVVAVGTGSRRLRLANTPS